MKVSDSATTNPGSGVGRSSATTGALRPHPRDTTATSTSDGNRAMSSSANAVSGVLRSPRRHREALRSPTTAGTREDDAADTASTFSTGTSLSVASSYRHYAQGPFMPPSPLQSQQTAALHRPQPVLVKDVHHQPKTRGSVGIMLIGLGGANGTTLLAGVLANRHKMAWHGPRGEPMTANYNGCITQLDQRGVHGGVGYRNKIKGLADASMAAIGGWDIRATPPGDALLEQQILDYDLVRQLRDSMNQVKVFRGVYDARFIGSSQHDTATHVLTRQEAATDAERLKCLRADIRYFKWRNGVVGHTTVIWSASVEPNCELLATYATANALLDAIEQSEEERGGPLPPSVLYATAALLEGCSFINGGSQNTLSCPGLAELAREQLGVYCLGTDFKAGQTKFKTAAVEYLRTMGLIPLVIASSNHLGNNDMRNLASSKAASSAKLRVKHDIFAPWQEEQLDHKVSIMFTEFINDDKRDFVEYTSLGFLGQPHTMVTYTRASDSVLCVPLMIDGAVWCDYFASKSWPYDKVAKALAYLFKVPEGAAKDVDPGFFRQMQELDTQVLAAAQGLKTAVSSQLPIPAASNSSTSSSLRRESSFNGTKKRVRIRPDEKSTEWAIPHDARIVCAGLACVDMQLNSASGGYGGESIETFEGEQSIGGGSVSMACKSLARLCHGAPLDDGYMQVTPPVVHSVIPLCKIGNDGTGDKLISLLEHSGRECRNVETKYIKVARKRDNTARTALAVLPIYQNGRRGCFFDAASNATFSAREMVELINNLSHGSSGPVLDMSHLSADDIESYHADLEQMNPVYGAFLFGYPHLLPQMQGEALAQVLLEARSFMLEGGIIALDLNGVPEGTFATNGGKLRSVHDLRKDDVIGAALEHVDILHLNEDELELLTGCELQQSAEDDFAIAQAVQLFLMCGVAIVAITRGHKGCYVSCNDADRFRRSSALPASWIDCTAQLGAVELPDDTIINGNGAGDAFTAGLLVAAMLRHTGMTVPSLDSTKSETKSAVSRPEPFELRTPPVSPRPVSHAGGSSDSGSASKKKKQLTPYTLYMRENYVTLKAQCHDDKKAIFSMCHEMWENESDAVKSLYERKAQEENIGNKDDIARNMLTDMENIDATANARGDDPDNSMTVARNVYMTNRSLNLESALQFASLMAAYHIDVSTRDRSYLDLGQLLERAVVFPSGLEEI